MFPQNTCLHSVSHTFPRKCVNITSAIHRLVTKKPEFYVATTSILQLRIMSEEKRTPSLRTSPHPTMVNHPEVYAYMMDEGLSSEDGSEPSSPQKRTLKVSTV